MTVCVFGGSYTRGAEGLEVQAKREILKERKTCEEKKKEWKEERGNETGSSREREREKGEKTEVEAKIQIDKEGKRWTKSQPDDGQRAKKVDRAG